MSSESLKLIAYNTSFANDAHWSQLHPGLSESAAIVAKATEIYKNENKTEPNTFNELNDFFMKDADENGTNTEKDNKFKPVDITDENIKNAMKQKLGYFRMQLADSATNYLKTQMQTVGFVALIEQMIHVPINHQAYYGGVLAKSNLDLTQTYNYTVPYNGDVEVSIPPPEDGFNGKNKYFGILRRINQLNLYDIDGNGYDNATKNENKIVDDNATKNIIVYDNIVNVDSGKFGGAAEGIAIIVNNQVCSSDKLFVWKKSTHPNKIVGNSNGFKNEISDDKSVHYYSDDFGQVISRYRDSNKPNRIRLVRWLDGFADLGRPIILTAGLNNEILHIFVALHSVNIFNMAYLDDAFYGDDDTLSDEMRKNVKKLTKIGNLENTDEMDVLKKNIYTIIYTQIGKFISEAFEKVSEINIDKNTKIQLYLGGDFNDPEGEILSILLKNGVSFEIKGITYEIGFNSDSNLTSLYSCCANRDSQKNKKDPEKKDKAQIDQTVGPLENAFNRVFGQNTIGNSTTPIEPLPYDPQDFYKFETFGYNGDYALFGTNSNSSKFEIKLDIADSAFYKYDGDNKVMASDHLPVYATVVITKGGRRRRYSRVLKRNTKKGLPKKLRASRRKRRAYTYKKH